MGWACQTSTFIYLDEKALDKLSVDRNCRTQAVHWFMDEHKKGKCSPHCLYPLITDSEVHIDKLINSQHPTILNWPIMEYASILFGAGECSEFLITTSDEIVMIDCEQMFSTPIRIGSPFQTTWCHTPDGTMSENAKTLKLSICRDVLALSDMDIDQCLNIPTGVTINELWSIRKCIEASRLYARFFIDTNS